MAFKNFETEDQRFVLNVAWVAHTGAGAETGRQAERLLRQWLPADAFILTDQPPDILLFMSGGSERKALSLMDPDRPVLLLSAEGRNAYAAATEVMAWAAANRRIALLADAQDAFETGLIDRWRETVGAWRRLRGKKAALIGSVSDWLVASDVPAEKLLRRFGVALEQISWDSLPDYRKQEPDSALLRRLNDHDPAELIEAAKVLTVLRQVLTGKALNALAVECFSLVRERKVTACLALAELNAEGTVAACEGDTASLAGLMLVKAVSGSVPWMANTTRLTGNRLLLSHCSVPFHLVDPFDLTTHYETDCSLAVRGNITASDVTVFRLSSSLDSAFIAEGKVTGRPALPNACRTQAEIELPASAISLLRNKPLGNHLLMAPGNIAERLKLACLYKGINITELP